MNPREIPVTFTFEGKEYTGALSKVSGGSSHNKWHLMINKFYHGQLWNTELYGWRMDMQFESLAAYFGNIVEEWEKNVNS